ncbi:hypothetical protein PPN31114_01895 [Pandoraea pneumonica]|uniref:Uncharacterized protein n=1 Tax=Pandoraea pneumonica TaxID=2508299 RepID=A0A5E4UA06_9BURK|nr:hypothetical protein [Pandoraea pneumonica]VVD96611.1 hypothetical protein PPN31114_01895 [Pandoraea pneumonica]
MTIVYSRRMSYTPPANDVPDVSTQPNVSDFGIDERVQLFYHGVLVPDSIESLTVVLQQWHHACGNTVSQMWRKSENSAKEQWPKHMMQARKLEADSSGYVRIRGGWIAIEPPAKFRAEGWTRAQYHAYIEKLGVKLPLLPTRESTNRGGTHSYGLWPSVQPVTYAIPKFKSQTTGGDNLLVGGSTEGFLGGVNSLLGAHKSKMGVFQDFYNLMQSEGEVATKASRYATEIQRLISEVRNDSDKKNVPPEMNEFIRKYIGDDYVGERNKGELEALRDHLNNLASARKSTNEKLLLNQNEISGLLKMLIEMATNLLRMFGEIRSSITANFAR